MESFKQKRANLLNDNPIAARAGGSWISKHSIAAGSPLRQGGSSKGSPMYKDRKLTDEEAGFEKNTKRDLRDGSSARSASPSSTKTWQREQARIEEQKENAQARKTALEAKRKAKKAADLKSGK